MIKEKVRKSKGAQKAHLKEWKELSPRIKFFTIFMEISLWLIHMMYYRLFIRIFCEQNDDELLKFIITTVSIFLMIDKFLSTLH